MDSPLTVNLFLVGSLGKYGVWSLPCLVWLELRLAWRAVPLNIKWCIENEHNLSFEVVLLFELKTLFLCWLFSWFLVHPRSDSSLTFDFIDALNFWSWIVWIGYWLLFTSYVPGICLFWLTNTCPEEPYPSQHLRTIFMLCLITMQPNGKGLGRAIHVSKRSPVRPQKLVGC